LPFFCEWLYQRLVVDVGLAVGPDGDSIHLQRYPEVDERLRDLELERQVEVARRVVGLGMALRERERIGVRRPLRSLTVASTNAEARAALQRFAADILGELNVKQLDVVEDDSALVAITAKANFKVLGKKLGKQMKAVAEKVEQLDAPTLRGVLAGGSLEIEGHVLAGDDLLIRREPLAGRVAQTEGDLTVVLDANVDEALEHEGLARELINRIQNLRKEAGLEVSDRIALTVVCPAKGKLATALVREDLRTLVAGEVLAHSLTVNEGQASGHRGTAEIDGEAIDLVVVR
jgi:isoleucyl-tRNA synthetase